MKLTAKLTSSWNYKNTTELTAEILHKKAIEHENYLEFLSSQFTQNNIHEIYRLDRLFRKSTRGFQPIKKFVGALSEIEDNKHIVCYIDAFAYSFLKGAKNFDLLVPLDRKQDEKFIQQYQNWSIDIKNLEIFERFGKENISQEQKKQYLALRKVVSRPSVRDEIRTLATLLVSGASTLEEVSKDLGLHYTLGQRNVNVFERIGIVEKRQQAVYAIASEALSVVIFCLRESIGLDLLSNLDI